MDAGISLRFRGVRVIHSSPSQDNMTTGGNTSCIELSDGTHTVFINAGFGMNLSGEELIQQHFKSKKPVEVTVLFSDFLWDSLMGLPFFTPIHFKSSRFSLITGCPVADLRAGIDDVSSPLFSPFNGFDSFQSKIQLVQACPSHQSGPWTIDALTTPHPLTPYPTTTWKVTHCSGPSIGFVMLAQPTTAIMTEICNFLTGCQTVVCSASTSPSNDHWDQHRLGFNDALQIAQTLNPKDFFLCQFHPHMTDAMLQSELENLRQQSGPLGGSPPTTSGISIHLASELESFPIKSITPVYSAG